LRIYKITFSPKTIEYFEYLRIYKINLKFICRMLYTTWLLNSV
jgi:hypothetical protein